MDGNGLWDVLWVKKLSSYPILQANLRPNRAGNTMRTRVLSLAIVAVVLVSWGTALGQAPLKFGVKVGLSVSRLKVSNQWDFLDSRTALAGGGFLVIDLPGFWAIQAEALYVPKGATDEISGTDENGLPTGIFTMTYQINYLEIPVLVRASLGSSPVYLIAGPALAFKLSSKITNGDMPEILQDPIAGDQDWEGLTDTDFGLVFGVGAALPTGFGEIVFDARYTMGMSNIDDTGGWETKNGAFLLMAGVAF